jgi:hypothetical protein
MHWQQRKGIPCELITGFLKVMDIIWRICLKLLCYAAWLKGQLQEDGCVVPVREQDRLWLCSTPPGPQTIEQRSMNLQHQTGVITQGTWKNLKGKTSWLLRSRENRALRKTFGPKGDEVTSVRRKPHRVEL